MSTGIPKIIIRRGGTHVQVIGEAAIKRFSFGVSFILCAIGFGLLTIAFSTLYFVWLLHK